MWPWSEIKRLEKALSEKERERRLAEYRADWLEHQLKKANERVMDEISLGDKEKARAANIQLMLADEQRKVVELLRRINVLEATQ